MTGANYVSDLEEKLHAVDKKIGRSRKLLESNNVNDQVRALSELARLRQRHDGLAKRIEEAKAKGAENWGILHMDFQEDVDALADMLERWLTKLD